MRAMKKIASAVLLCLLAASVCAQEKAVPVGEEGHHQLVLENEYTRVFHVVLAPKESTLMHQHDRDYVYVMIGLAQVEVVKPDSATQMKLNDGDVNFTKAPLVHKVTNTGETPFVNLTVEVKKPSTKAVCGASWAGVEAEKKGVCGMTLVTGLSGETHHLETDEVEAVTYFAAGSGTGFTYDDADNPRLLVAISPLRCLCGSDQDLKMSAGDVAWLPKGILADISKIGNSSPEIVLVSFK
jgi:quercetin dioxygenase-like cupin family protein